MPSGARPIFQSELARLAHAPGAKAISLQSAVVLVIGAVRRPSRLQGPAGRPVVHPRRGGPARLLRLQLHGAGGAGRRLRLLFVLSGVFLTCRLLGRP
jgi:membrane protein